MIKIAELVLMIILVATLLGCSQSLRKNNNLDNLQVDNNQEIPNGFIKVKKAPQKPNEDIGRSLSVASPQTCFDLLPSYRSLSYTQKSCIKLGKQFESTLPSNKVGIQDDSVLFFPSNHSENMQIPAYCVFRFSILDYDQNPTIGFSWGNSNGFIERPNCWVGLGNKTMKAWDWFQVPTDNVLTVESFKHYQSTNGDLLIIIAVAGDKRIGLNRLTIGAYELVTTGAMIRQSQVEEKPDMYIDPNLPSSFDLSSDGVPVGNQLDWGACVPFAICQGAFNHELTRIYKKQGWKPSLTKNQLSPKYVYAESGKCGPDEGRYMDDILNGVLFEFGDCSEDVVPYNTESSDKNWSDTAYKEAKLFKYDKYTFIKPNQLNELKALIYNGYPIITSSLVDSWWDGLKTGDSKIWTYNRNQIGGHAYTLVGFDDSLKAFKVQNSWGSGWCDNGYTWISYKNFTDYSKELSLTTTVLFDNYSPELVSYLGLSPATIQPPVNANASLGTFKEGILISWNKVPTATEYNIYRDSSMNLIKTVENTTSYLDTSVTDPLSHFYWVKAKNSTYTSELSTLTYGYRKAISWGGYEIDPVKVSLNIIPAEITLDSGKNEKISLKYSLKYDGIAVDNPASPLYFIAQTALPKPSWFCSGSPAFFPEIATFYSNLASPKMYTVRLFVSIPTKPQDIDSGTNVTIVEAESKITVK